jgi:hypothetical protein
VETETIEGLTIQSYVIPVIKEMPSGISDPTESYKKVF